MIRFLPPDIALTKEKLAFSRFLTYNSLGKKSALDFQSNPFSVRKKVVMTRPGVKFYPRSFCIGLFEAGFLCLLYIPPDIPPVIGGPRVFGDVGVSHAVPGPRQAAK